MATVSTSTDTIVRAGIRLGAMKHYLVAYESVFRSFEEADELQTLVPAANTLLERMLLQKLAAVDASVALQKEMSTDQAREIVRAVTVDVLLNDRVAGQHLTRLATRAETYARL